MKGWSEDVNMNKALIERFVFLLPREHRDLYQNTLIGNPNGRFGDTLNSFYREYGIRDKMELDQSRERMKAPWNTVDGFEILRKRF